MSGLVDWGIAARVSDLAAGDSPPAPEHALLALAVAESANAVVGYTGLEPEQSVPDPEWVSRREWARINLGSLEATLGQVEDRFSGGPGLPGPLAGTVSGTLGAVAGAQIGALVGYASRRVLGQFEFPILGPERRRRLLFVAPNVAVAQRELGGEPRTVLRWIALHEVTHAVHFGAAPWMREHLRALATELLSDSSIGIGPAELAEAGKRLASTDPRKLLAELRDSDPLSLLTASGSGETLARTQATMAAVEGYAEHVMDAAAPALGEQVGDLRFAMERRRDDRPPLARLLAWLLGMELKLRQYRDGKRFCDGVVELADIESLNAAWQGPESLPTQPELADPGAWLQRTAPVRA